MSRHVKGPAVPRLRANPRPGLEGSQAFGAIARSGNVSELARRIGMSREGLYKAVSADGIPSFATVMKVARALGLKLQYDSVA